MKDAGLHRILDRDFLMAKSMRQILSQFHYMTLLVDGGAFASAERLHEELAFKLGLPGFYGRNWDALLDCLSSIDDPAANLCSHWDFRIGKRLVLQVQGFSADNADPKLLLAFAQVVADANARLRNGGKEIAIWIEFN